ncbi:hypothetical protein GCM10022243_31570 [Saccharothrix violaceirubra]
MLDPVDGLEVYSTWVMDPAWAARPEPPRQRGYVQIENAPSGTGTGGRSSGSSSAVKYGADTVASQRAGAPVDHLL